MPASRRTRDPHRKQRILDSAVELVARDGYAAVNLTDIGAAAGIVGSGIYRHFDSKGAILVELFDQVIDRLIENADRALAARVDPAATAASLVRMHIDLTLSERKLLRIYVQESRNLPDSDQIRLRWKQRHYIDLLIDILMSARPEVSRPEAQLAVHASFGAIHSVLNFQSELDRAGQERLLCELTMNLLGLPAMDASSPEQSETTAS